MPKTRVIRMCQEFRVAENVLDGELDGAMAAVMSTIEQHVAEGAPMGQWWDITNEEES